MWNLFLQIISGVLGLWLADRFVPGVDFNGPFFIIPKSGVTIGELLGSLVAVGILLGLLNFFVKPILKTITLPLRVITLNLFSLIIAMALVWVIDIFSPELVIRGLLPLFWTAVIVWLLNFLFSKWMPAKPPYQVTK